MKSFSFYTFIDFIFGCEFCFCMGFSLVVDSGGRSVAVACRLLMQWLLLLQTVGSGLMGFSSCSSWALEHRLSSFGACTSLLYCMWNLPRSGIVLVSPTLAGKFFTTEPPEKPQNFSFNFIFDSITS